MPAPTPSSTPRPGGMRPNLLREALRSGRPTIGTHLHSRWPSIVELVGVTGAYDYVELSAEYIPFDLPGLDDFCRAAELHGLGTMIKLDQAPRSFLAQRAIGSGFGSVLFADVRTVDDARECVRVCRPDVPGVKGTYGAADRRNSYWGHAGTADYVRALNEIVVVLMIEKEEAVAALDEILAVPGIDMIQWGPGDYAMSIGRPGDWYHPDVRAVEEVVLAKALAAGIPPRAEINAPEEADRYRAMGVRHFCIGTDMVILHDWFSRAGRELRERVGEG